MAPNIRKPKHSCNSKTFRKFLRPLKKILKVISPLEAGGDRPLQMSFEDQLKSLTYFHIEEHESARALLQALEENEFARQNVAPEKGIKKSAFSEAINGRGLEQLAEVYQALQSQALRVLPRGYEHLGELRAIDGSLIDAVLSMHWADYSSSARKAKVHLSFDINRGIPRKIFLTNGKANERPFVSQLISPGETAVLDRGYQDYDCFDLWQEEGKHFACRIKTNSVKEVICTNDINHNSNIFYDSVVLLGTKSAKQTKKPVRLVAYRIGRIDYWIATDRFDLTADEIAMIYKLRWQIEKFFGWWKRHMRVYHLIARSGYGLMVQILSGLITYLLLAIYCQREHGQKVTKKLLRRLRHNISNEATFINDETLAEAEHVPPSSWLTLART